MLPTTEAKRIESAKVAGAFEHPQSRRILLALVPKALSLKDLGRATGLSLSLLHYHVGRLQRLGLIEIVGEDRRSSRAVKRYRATAERFFVPAALATRNAHDAMLRDLRMGLERAQARCGDEGVEYTVDDDGRPRMTRVRGETKPGAFEVWMMLSLTPQEAQSLGEALEALLQRYAGRRTPGSRPMLTHCAFAEKS